MIVQSPQAINLFLLVKVASNTELSLLIYFALHSRRWLGEQQRRFSTECRSGRSREAWKQKQYTDKQTKQHSSSMYVGLNISSHLPVRFRWFTRATFNYFNTISSQLESLGHLLKNRAKEQSQTSLAWFSFVSFCDHFSGLTQDQQCCCGLMLKGVLICRI